jgi:hypothetical protein
VKIVMLLFAFPAKRATIAAVENKRNPLNPPEQIQQNWMARSGLYHLATFSAPRSVVLAVIPGKTTIID